MSNWPTKKLGEVCNFQNGFAFKSSDYVDNGHFVMRITNVQDGRIELNNPKYIKNNYVGKNNPFVLSEGDILISLTGNVGRVGVIKAEHLPAVLNQRVARISIKLPELLEKDYLFSFLRSPSFFKTIVSGGKGMAQQNVSTNFISEITIPLPPLEEQKKIVKVLEDRLGKVKEVTKLREEAITDTEKILSSRLTEILVESSDKSWPYKTLDTICEIARGGSPRPIKDYITEDSGGINWIKIADASASGRYIYQTKEKIKPEGLRKTRKVHSGDLLLTNSMSFGRPYILKTDGAIHDGWLLLSPREKLSPEYLYYILGSREIYSQFKSLAGGAVVQNLNSELVRGVKVPLPSFEEQIAIVKELDELSEQVTELRKIQELQLADMKSLAQAYLREAFSGELV